MDEKLKMKSLITMVVNNIDSGRLLVSPRSSSLRQSSVPIIIRVAVRCRTLLKIFIAETSLPFSVDLDSISSSFNLDAKLCNKVDEWTESNTHGGS